MRATEMLSTSLAVLLVAGPAGATTVEEVIEKHVQARGGHERWQAIETMKITGSFTAFSKVSPFTMHRKRGSKYHMDHVWDDKKVVVGYDGRTAWWDNEWLQPGAQLMRGTDLEAWEREFDFVTPLFDYADKDYEVKLVGTVDLEGQETIGIELTRPDETVETWYLDPETHLEVARDSPGSDFGTPMPQRSYFDDFREVAGVRIPHLTESQWYTRDRVMRIDRIETNVEIDDELFVMPSPTGMGAPIRLLAGTFDVAAAKRQQPGADWSESTYRSTIEPLLRGALLQESFTTAEGNAVVRTLSFDRFKERYRLTQINDSTTHLDVREGQFDEQGRLIVSNVETGTASEGFGMTFHGRISIFDITDGGFQLHQEISIDGGESWFLAAKQTYTRTK